jgi:hypothetical protein
MLIAVVLRQLDIKEGDKLHWEFAVGNGEIIVKFRKIKGLVDGLQ